MFLIATSAVTAPAYSLTVKESGPLTGFSQSLPAMQDADTITVKSLEVDGSAIKNDFGAIDLGEMKSNGNPSRTLVYGSGNVAALGNSARVMGLGGSMESGQPLLGVAVSESPLPSSLGFSYAADSPLQFDFDKAQASDPGRLSGSSIIGSDRVADEYGVTGAGDPNIHNMLLQVGDRKRMNVTGMSEYRLDTTELPDGKYDLMLVATDIAGNEATVVMPIVVANNAPQIMFAIIAGLAAGGGIASVAWFVFARRRV